MKNCCRPYAPLGTKGKGEGEGNENCTKYIRMFSFVSQFFLRIFSALIQSMLFLNFLWDQIVQRVLLDLHILCLLA